jgi:hypothetical protein
MSPELRASLPPAVEPHFGIAVVRLEAVAGTVELAAEPAVFVDAAVEDDGKAALLRTGRGDLEHHGLVTAGRIDDRKAAMDEGNIDRRAVAAQGPIAKTAGPVRAAVCNALIQDVEPAIGNCSIGRGDVRPRGMDAKDSGDAAHERMNRRGAARARDPGRIWR